MELEHDMTEVSVADVQHHLVVSVPVGQTSRVPGTAVPGSDKCLSRRQGAKQ